jgi:chemotaxis signal transduction protein
MGVYVRLRVASEAYAIPVENVLEVADLGEVRAVPGAPPKVLGIRNLRGQILPVVDLALLLGIARQGRPRLLLVAESGGCQTGFAVDEVRWVGELGPRTQDAESDLLVGAVLSGSDLVGVIDVGQLFGSLAGT